MTGNRMLHTKCVKKKKNNTYYRDRVKYSPVIYTITPDYLHFKECKICKGFFIRFLYFFFSVFDEMHDQKIGIGKLFFYISSFSNHIYYTYRL